MIFSLLPSTRLDLGLCFRSCGRNFFVFYATNPISGIRAVSMHRLVARVEHNCFVGIDALLSLVRVLCILRDGGMKLPGLTLHDHVHETCSTLDMQLVLHKWLCGCLSLPL